MLTWRVPVAPDVSTWIGCVNGRVLVHALAQKSMRDAKVKLNAREGVYAVLSFMKNFASYLKYGADNYVWFVV